jgi:hypothetical protein
MDGDDPVVDALLTAFNVLIGVAKPARVGPVLRHALTTLLAEETASAQPGPGNSRKRRNRGAASREVWSGLRDVSSPSLPPAA